MQELAFVPMLKRQKHDQLIAEQEAIRSGLAKVDPLDVHYNEALNLKNQIESEIDKTSQDLATNGFSNDMTGKTIALNRRYNDLISPTGRLGQINAAKTYYNQQKEEFIKNAESQKIGRDRALQLWNEKTSNYTGFDPNNKITKVTPQGVAAFQNYGEDLSRAHSILGKTVQGLSSSGHHLEQDDNGGFWEVTKNNKRVKSDNTKQVEAAYNSFRDKWIAENGEGSRYSKDAGLGIDEKRIQNDFNSMLENSNILDSSESANYNTPPKNSGDKDNPNGFGLTEASNNFISDKYSDKNYSDIEDIIAKNKNATTSEGKQSYYEALSFKNKLDKTLSKDPELNKLKKQLEDTQKKFQTIKNNPFKTFDSKGNLVDSGYKTEQSKNTFRQTQESNYINSINKIKEQINNKSKDYIQKNNLESTDYMLTPYSKKQQGVLEVASDNIQQLFQSNPENIKSFVNIESIGTPEGNILHNISGEDKETISKILHNAKKGDIVLTRVAGKGISGKPEYVLRVTPNDESEKLYGNNSFWSKSKLTDKPFEVRVSFNKSKSNANINNVNGLIKDYVSGAGSQGQQLSKTMDLYEKYGNHSYNEFKQDPQLKPLILDLIIKDGENPNSPYHKMKTVEEGINYFLKHHGNEQIDFHSN
jgi:hypothetical protein